MTNAQKDSVAVKSIISQELRGLAGGAEDVAVMLEIHKANLANPRVLRHCSKFFFPKIDMLTVTRHI